MSTHDTFLKKGDIPTWHTKINFYLSHRELGKRGNRDEMSYNTLSEYFSTPQKLKHL